MKKTKTAVAATKGNIKALRKVLRATLENLDRIESNADGANWGWVAPLYSATKSAKQCATTLRNSFGHEIATSDKLTTINRPGPGPAPGYAIPEEVA